MLKTITIDSFAGGRTNFYDQSLIGNDTCASGSQNVWAPNGSLTKTPGVVLQAAFTATASGGNCPHVYTDENSVIGKNLYYRIASAGAPNSSFWTFVSNGFTDTLAALGYTNGSISISGASLISATGSSAFWTVHASAGDLINIATTSTAWYKIASVEDNTHLTLANAVPQAVSTGTAYTVLPGLDFLEIAAASLNGAISWVTTGNIMQQYNASATAQQITRNSSAPQAAYLATWKGYLFAARTNAFPSRLIWSFLKQPDNWPANNFVDIDKDKGSISGLFPYGNELIVFKMHGMYKVLGDVFDPSNPTYVVQQIPTPPDFTFNSNNSVAIHKGILTFYGGGRIYQYRQGTLFINDISKGIIRDLPTSFGNITDSMANLDQRVQAVVFNDYYIIKGLAASSGYYFALILDTNSKWWYATDSTAPFSIDNFDTGKMVVLPSLTSRPQLITTSRSAPHVWTWDFVGPNYGTNYAQVDSSVFSQTVNSINSIWMSKEFNIEYGTFKWIVVYLQKQTTGTASLSVDWSVDQGTFVTNAVDMTVGRGQIIRKVLPVQQKGSTIQLRITHNTQNETFRIYGIKIFYEESLGERIA